MKDGFWLVRLGRLSVYDWSLEDALASAFRVKRHARESKAAKR